MASIFFTWFKPNNFSANEENGVFEVMRFRIALLTFKKWNWCFDVGALFQELGPYYIKEISIVISIIDFLDQ